MNKQTAAKRPARARPLRGEDEGDPRASELHLGAYWEHNKNTKELLAGNELDNVEQKPISLRVIGIPQISSLSVGKNWALEEVRYQLARESGVKQDDIEVYFGGEKMVMDLVVSNCGIQDDSIITAVLLSRV